MSRTHSQLEQVSKELEKTCYRPNMAVFGSRDQLCIKQDFKLLRGKEKLEACGKAVVAAKKVRRQQERGQHSDLKLIEASCQYYQKP